MMDRRRAALALLLLLASAALCVRGQGAQPAGSGAASCADLPPSPPISLRAKASDGFVELTWGLPANKACVDSYQITVLPSDPARPTAGPLPRMSTTATTFTIRGLANGAPLRIFVRAVSTKYGPAGEAQVMATPSRAADDDCLQGVLPSAPTNVTARPGVDSITLTWGAPINGACVSEYRVAVRPQGSAAAPRYLTAPATSTSITINQLPSGQLMSVAVQAFSAAARGGAHTTVLAAALARPRQWTCSSVPSFYPLCGAAAAGLCTPFSCKEQAAAGKCGSAYLRMVDLASKVVVQYCANECACELPTSAATPSTTAEPRVKAFDGGSTDAIAGTVASNEAAGRSIAPPSVADVDRWDGCCATPVRRPSNSWEDVDEAAL